jgi:hypothetical protein
MKRREAIATTAVLVGSAFLWKCSSPDKPVTAFDDNVIALLDEVGETILPATPSSPGAKEAKIGQFMKTMVTDCFNEKERAIFFEGVATLQQTAQANHSKDFVKLSPKEKYDILLPLDKASRVARKENEPEHFFSMMRRLTTQGFFSSEPGATKALRFVPIPGRYEGCIAYNGEPAWLY